MNTPSHTLYRDFLTLDSLKGAQDDPKRLHQSILETVKIIEYSILYIGLGLVKIKMDKLYKELGFKNMSAYVQHLVEVSQRNRSSIYKWLQIGEIYIKYRGKLEEIGFTSKNSPTKLPYLERALKKKPVKEVYDNIMIMTQREFANFAKTGEYARDTLPNNFQEITDITTESVEETVIETSEITNDDWGYIFSYRDQTAVKVNKKLGKRALGMLLSSINMALNALNRRGFVVAVHLDNYREYRRFGPIAKEAREKMRATFGRTTMDREEMGLIGTLTK